MLDAIEEALNMIASTIEMEAEAVGVSAISLRGILAHAPRSLARFLMASESYALSARSMSEDHPRADVGMRQSNVVV